MSRDPAQWLADLRAAEASGQVPALWPFFGHRGRPGTVGPWVLSQWWPAWFTVDGVAYRHAEAYMMAAKARLFDDAEVLAQILASSDPKEAKALGRKVRGFDPAVWDAHAYDLVVAGNLAKFGQHPQLGRYLASTAGTVLVEASPYDRVWGIGLSLGDPRTRRPSQWRGRNLLGFALTEVRDRLSGRGGS